MLAIEKSNLGILELVAFKNNRMIKNLKRIGGINYEADRFRPSYMHDTHVQSFVSS